MVSTPDCLDDAADQPALQIDRDLLETSPVNGDGPIALELEQRHAGLGDLRLLTGALALGHRAVGRRNARSPQTRPLEPGVEVRGVVDPDNASRPQGRRKPGPRHAEQRSQQTDVGPFEQCRHAGKPIGAAAARGAHGHRLGLIVGLMRDQQVQDAVLAAGIAQQTIARLPGGLLDASRRLRSRPLQHVACDALVSQLLAGRLSFAGRLGAQAMVDNEGSGSAAPLSRPSVGQQGEAERIPAARNGDGQLGSRLERRERRHQAFELPMIERCRSDLVAHPQPFFWRS